MPIPEKRNKENKDAFISRCMNDEVMKSEFSSPKQRYAVCLSQFTAVKKAKGTVSEKDFDSLREKSYFLF